MTPQPQQKVGTGMLLAAACGTAIAAISALGLIQMERLAGGLWSVAAVGVGGLICWGVARAFGRLAAVIPSGAGLVAYLARGLGRRAGMAVALPYLLLTLFLVGVEALVVGTMLARLLGVPPLAGAIGLVLVTWLVARAGVRFGYRTQAITTSLLVAGMSVLAVVVVVRHASAAASLAWLVPPAPGVARFAAAVGQALFLFMGFELVTTQIEVARSPASVRRALGASVAVLAAFYGLSALGFAALPAAAARDPLVPQLEVARAAGGTPAVVLCVLLCLLACFTSLNGALLALSRFIYALASQGVLPRPLAVMHGRRLVPRRALAALAAVAVGSTLLVTTTRVVTPVILAAASAAALAYAGAVLVRQRAPFAEAGRGALRRAAGVALAAALAALGVAVVTDASTPRGPTLAALGAAVAASLLLAGRTARRPQAPRAPLPEVRRAS
jgi:amino acid transporter